MYPVYHECFLLSAYSCFKQGRDNLIGKLLFCRGCLPEQGWLVSSHAGSDLGCFYLAPEDFRILPVVAACV